MSNKPIYLGVNVDHVATIREARGTDYPQVFHAALIAEQGGADGITIHLREDRRHIQDRDVELVKECINSRLNLEMAVTDEMLTIAEKNKPSDCCLVPEKREELTTEGGLDVSGQMSKMEDACKRLVKAGVRASLFIDADKSQIDAAHAIGAPVIEIHTGHFADAATKDQEHNEYLKIVEAVKYANNLGLQVNAGHGLHYHNVQQIAAIENIVELNIGHSIIAQSIFTGLGAAVKEMKRLMVSAII